MFERWTNHPKRMCKEMLLDAELEQKLPKNRYVRVFFEDLMEKPFETLKSIYEKLELPIDSYAINSVRYHLEEMPGYIEAVDKNKYSSIYKGASENTTYLEFLKKKASVEEIERKCAKTIDFYGYQRNITQSRP